jgi:hypothetical protein
MIITPAGEIEIFVDGGKISYIEESVRVFSLCEELDGRFCIRIKFNPDGDIHIISCCIANYIPSEMDGVESGENLELKSFYFDKSKVSLGMEADTGYVSGVRIDTYDYDSDYLENGVCYVVLPDTKTQEFVFGIAWLNNCTDENDLQTWFGTDATLL